MARDSVSGNISGNSTEATHKVVENDSHHTSKEEDQTQVRGLNKRIGRLRTDADGQEIWINQVEWEEDQIRTQNSLSDQTRFAFCLDDSKEKSEIKIICPILTKVIQQVVPFSYFRSSSGSISFEEPYAHLFQYFDDIKEELKVRYSPTADPFLDFCTLVSFLQNQAGYGSIWQSLNRGGQTVVSFENLWALFRGGELIVVRDRLEERRLFKFTRLQEDIKETGFQKDLTVAMEVHFWYVVWIPGRKRFRQKSQYFSIPRFAGHRKVTSLPIYPLRYEEEDSRQSLLKSLQTRGEKWADLVSKPPSCFEHSGNAISDKEDLERDFQNLVHLEGRIILDQRSSVPTSTIIEDVELQGSSNEVDEKLNDSWETPQPVRLTRPEQFQLCPAEISCYHVPSGERYIISVNNLKPVKWLDTAIKRLILDQEKKDMLTAIIRNNFSADKAKGGDIIANKGRGLTIVLHGPSGVGKTLTAECIAEHVKRPIIPLSVGNLVAMEDSIEDRLTEAFANASRLGAILLLDEADVVLEARSFEDVRRNGIVSVFLRHLEYYNGVLFLTTNRISSMDPAFQSRIQVAIAYSEFTKRERQDVWRSLLKSNLIECADRDREIIEDNLDRLAESKLNGRQIRNILKLSTFVALADPIGDHKVKLKHIEKALRDTLSFQDDLDTSRKDLKNSRNRTWKPFAPSQNRDYS